MAQKWSGVSELMPQDKETFIQVHNHTQLVAVQLAALLFLWLLISSYPMGPELYTFHRACSLSLAQEK